MKYQIGQIVVRVNGISVYITAVDEKSKKYYGFNTEDEKKADNIGFNESDVIMTV